MTLSMSAECAKKLAMLEKEAFEEAVKKLVARTYLDFQPVPTKPDGDGGVDGLTHGFTVGYCCYGIVDVPKHELADIVDKMFEKFSGDLERICEVKPKGKGNFVHVPNLALEAIMPDDTKLKHIFVVCNAFESNKVIGKLINRFKKLKKSSKRRFIEDDCGLGIHGPADIARVCTVTADLIVEMDQSLIVSTLAAAQPGKTAPPPTKQFDEKFDALEEALGSTQAVKQVRHDKWEEWLKYLGVIERFNSEEPAAFKRILDTLEDVSRDASLQFLGVSASLAPGRLGEYERLLQQRLEQEVPLPPASARSLASQMIGALIGECGVSWV